MPIFLRCTSVGLTILYLRYLDYGKVRCSSLIHYLNYSLQV